MATQLFIKKMPSLTVSRGTLLLLHGWGFDHRCWLALVPFLQREYDLLLLDLPGFGRSAPLAVDDVNAWLDQTLGLIEQQISVSVVPKQKVYVCGWSLGGQIALRLLQRDSQLAGALGVATNLQFRTQTSWPTAMAVEDFDAFLHNFLLAPEQTLKNFSRLVAAGDANFLALRRMLPGLLTAFEPALKANWYFALQALKMLDHRESKFDRPVLLLLSDNDALVPYDVAEALPEKCGVSAVSVAQASHGNLLIAPERAAELILSFVHAQS